MKKMLLIVAVAFAAISCCGHKGEGKCCKHECCKDSAAVCCQADSAKCCADEKTCCADSAKCCAEKACCADSAKCCEHAK